MVEVIGIAILSGIIGMMLGLKIGWRDVKKAFMILTYQDIKMAGNINGAIKASAIVALLIATPPVLIAMTYDDYPKYCKLSILLPCIGVNDE